jgi:hypothetical protein
MSLSKPIPDKLEMSNSEYIEYCEIDKVFDPPVAGFYFSPPIPNPIRDADPDESPLISKACFSCVSGYYFPRTEEQVKLDFYGKVQLDEAEEIWFNSNKAAYLTTISKDTINNAQIVQLVADPFEGEYYVYFKEEYLTYWDCDLCQSQSVY